MLRECEYFIAIAEENNLTRAAEKLRVSQPSLTQKLQRMERELNCKLLIRTNSGVKLTEAGQAYLKMARQMLHLYENFKFEIGQLRNLAYGCLRVGASWYLTTTLLPEIITAYSLRFPDIQVDCMESRTSVLLEALHNGQIDIAFTSQLPQENLLNVTECVSGASHCILKNQKRLTCLPIYRDPFCVVVASGTAIETRIVEPSDPRETAFVRMDCLRSLPFIMFHPKQRIRQLTDRVLSLADICPRIRLLTYGFPIAMAQAAAGLGAVILPRRYVDTVKDQYRIDVYDIPPEYQAYWDIGACYSHYDIMPFALEAFIEELNRIIGSEKKGRL